MAYMTAMTSRPTVKICGLSTPETLRAALDAGADMVGFVFFPKSPRHLDLAAARDLAAQVEGRAQKVALTVDADDHTLDAIVAAIAPDLLQLHGRETPERAAAIRARFGLPVMKAIGIASLADLGRGAAYAGAADRLLYDAKPAPGADLPGGNGLPFDWRLLVGHTPARPMMLSGGLGPHNVAEALERTGAVAVDVSSGVEVRPGEKDPALIRAFIEAARLGSAATLV